MFLVVCITKLGSRSEGNQKKTFRRAGISNATMRVIIDEHDIGPLSSATGPMYVPFRSFESFMEGQMLRVNVLLLGNGILMGVMVGIGAYGHRYRHHPLTRFLFMGATILFLPIVSYIVSITGSQFTVAVPSPGGIIAVGECDPSFHTGLVLVWTVFVQIVGINTTAMVAADDREGRSIAPPAVLLVQAVWTTYLGVNILLLSPDPSPRTLEYPASTHITGLPTLLILISFGLIFAKILFKYYAWYSAKQSFSFGRNPRLIVGYMTDQLPDDHRTCSQHATSQQRVPPPLVVSREDTMVVVKQPHGYRINNRSSSCSRRWSSSRSNSMSPGDHRSLTTTKKRECLVTIDKVWELDGISLNSESQLKDVCLSFSLFKMLRCRFAKYTITQAAGFIKAREFLWHLLLEDGDGTRTLGVIESELSFLHDYYYSSLPISYSKDWLPISSIFISLLSIGYCCLFGTIALRTYVSDPDFGGQIRCYVTYETRQLRVNFGDMFFDVLGLLLLDALVVLSEVREIASFVCSDWTKVALMCRYVSWHEYPTLRKWIGLLLQCRCKLVRPWQDNMSQCSIIVLRPRNFSPMALLRRLVPLSEPKKSVKLPSEVKAAIVNTLRSNRRGDDLRNGKISRHQLGIQVGDNFLRARRARGTSDTLLVWHIATTIFEARYPHSLASSSSGSIAMHLSCYCAYLVAYSPELLPDDDAWSKSLYKATKKGAERALHNVVPAPTPELECRQLVELLSAAGFKHEVLKEGARLGDQLVELMKGEEEEAWKALAGFWCEMILFMAPSDNLDGHAVAVARGGELLTLLWALLTHVGIPEATASTTATTMGSSASPDV